MFIPTTKKELDALGWEKCDIIFISGDAYIDTYFDGCALLGKYLIKHGFRVGIISQPDINSPDDISRLGVPELFWGVSGGAMDSMVANYTSLGLRRKEDDLTPGGINNKRPDRAVLKYVNLIQRTFTEKKLITIGGIEASLRRFAHYDSHTDKIRGSILADSKADILVFGMGERANLELAETLKNGGNIEEIRGICRMAKNAPEGFVQLPDFEECAASKDKFLEMSKLFFNSCKLKKGIFQKQAGRFVVQNPPARPLTSAELDEIHELDFERKVHPYYAAMGEVRALDTIKTSVLTHRGCFGACSFCSITAHQGANIISRSEESIIREITKMAKQPDFNGVISDLGGPTANMYGMDFVKGENGHCALRECLFPKVCDKLPLDHSRQIALLKRVRKIKNIKHIFISSGIRYDLILADKVHGVEYLTEILTHHISGQMKIAPEHIIKEVTDLMNKPDGRNLKEFKELFDRTVRKLKSPLFLTYYFIAAFPGCTERDQIEAKKFISSILKTNPKQVQIFTPTPSTEATALYWTEKSFDGKKIFVEKNFSKRKRQKEIITERKKI